jgi:hypothetical protein
MALRANINEPVIGGFTVSVGGNFTMQVPNKGLAEKIMEALRLSYQQGHEDRVQMIQQAHRA